MKLVSYFTGWKYVTLFQNFICSYCVHDYHILFYFLVLLMWILLFHDNTLAFFPFVLSFTCPFGSAELKICRSFTLSHGPHPHQAQDLWLEGYGKAATWVSSFYSFENLYTFFYSYAAQALKSGTGWSQSLSGNKWWLSWVDGQLVNVPKNMCRFHRTSKHGGILQHWKWSDELFKIGVMHTTLEFQLNRFDQISIGMSC